MTPDLTNPALAALGFLLGEWDMALSGASFLPDPEQVVHGRVEFSAIEDGRVLVMRQAIEPSGAPAATWLIGRDDSKAGYALLYADGCGVSRIYEMALAKDRWQMWRNDPEFSQRFEATITPAGTSIQGRWEKRESDGVWEHDFNVAYSRL